LIVTNEIEAGDLAAKLRIAGACAAGRLDDDPLVLALVSEASRHLQGAEVVERVEYQLGADEQKMRSPVRFATSDGDEVLHSVHHHPLLLDFVLGLVGRAMYPSKCAYLYFRDGNDFIGLHTDIPACELTLLLGLTGDGGRLVIYPELRDKSPQRLLETGRRANGAPEGGSSLPFHSAEIIALVGGRVPHQTPRRNHETPVVALATLCYVGEGPAL
jgi:hypothetical protein